MKLLRSLFGRRVSDKNEIGAVERGGEGSLNGSIGYEIDRLAMKIFVSHRATLLDEAPTFIIPAIWGTEGIVGVTEMQENIHALVHPAVERIVDSLRLSNLDVQQELAIRYIVRYMLLNKLLYMIELFRNISRKGAKLETGMSNDFDTLTPLGSA